MPKAVFYELSVLRGEPLSLPLVARHCTHAWKSMYNILDRCKLRIFAISKLPTTVAILTHGKMLPVAHKGWLWLALARQKQWAQKCGRVCHNRIQTESLTTNNPQDTLQHKETRGNCKHTQAKLLLHRYKYDGKLTQNTIYSVLMPKVEYTSACNVLIRLAWVWKAREN